MHGTGQI